MARRGFRIHSSARFNPFSYQELIAPLNEYEQAYGQMQDAMLTLGEEANQYRQLIDTDEYASGVLKGYNDALNEMSGALSSQGLKSVNRNTLIGLRRKYNNEVKPVNDAAKTLSELQDMYRKAFANDGTLMRSAMPSIRDLVENPGAMPHMVSGRDLYKQGAQAAQSSSARIYNSDFGNRINGYIEQVAKQGYSPEIVAQFIQDANSIPELARDMQNIREMYKTGSLEDKGYQADKFIMQGILDGITYQQKENYVQDWQAHLAAQLANSKELANYKAGLTAQKKAAGTGSGIDYNNIIKSPLYIKDGVPTSKSTVSQEEFDQIKKGSQVVTPKDLMDMSTENKFQLLVAAGLDRSMLLDGFTGEYDESMIDQAIQYFGNDLSSMFEIYAWSRTMDQSGAKDGKGRPMYDTEGNKVRTKTDRKDSSELLLIPKGVIRNTDSNLSYGYGYGAGYDTDYTGLDLLGDE